ncbi:SfnB family sulfur acquisition oxidoreductase [Verticiella sediminum]|uniref:SfnB family sulfur acquisition oxidoreductase n=1 Tax=Verticiella sediminum TaxID=1247510 RepID=A0A556ANM1_9BURK|nr:SfnB family sulfur acquisition oxidoreductase [Verticiella sediminum]TSH94483.1 SfnB family sulfur acquisition oxidoreductase [Verticiella sediminum]
MTLELSDPPAATGGVHRIGDDAEAIELARALAEDFALEARTRDQERRLPYAEVERYSRSGLWAITVPRAHGGAGVSTHTLTRVIALVAAADGSLGHIPQNHFYALEALRVGGTEAQQAFFYQRALAGDRFGNALAEIGHKDYRRRTTLRRDGAAWRLDGRKFYCTGALFADWIPTLAVSQDESGENSHLVFVPADAPGVQVTDDWDGFGQRVTGSGSVHLQDVHVQPEWIVPFKASFERPTTIGPFAQIMHAAIDAGIGHGALQALLPWVREHARPWVDAGVERADQDPLLVAQIGDVHVRLRAADALIARAARIVDAARRAPDEQSVARASVAVAQAKAASTRASLLAANKLLELGGTSATLNRHGLDRYWRNARTHTLHDPVRWKYHAIGNYYLNGRIPPRHGAI